MLKMVVGCYYATRMLQKHFGLEILLRLAFKNSVASVGLSFCLEGKSLRSLKITGEQRGFLLIHPKTRMKKKDN